MTYGSNRFVGDSPGVGKYRYPIENSSTCSFDLSRSYRANSRSFSNDFKWKSRLGPIFGVVRRSSFARLLGLKIPTPVRVESVVSIDLRQHLKSLRLGRKWRRGQHDRQC